MRGIVGENTQQRLGRNQGIHAFKTLSITAYKYLCIAWQTSTPPNQGESEQSKLRLTHTKGITHRGWPGKNLSEGSSYFCQDFLVTFLSTEKSHSSKPKAKSVAGKPPQMLLH